MLTFMPSVDVVGAASLRSTERRCTATGCVFRSISGCNLKLVAREVVGREAQACGGSLGLVSFRRIGARGFWIACRNGCVFVWS